MTGTMKRLLPGLVLLAGVAACWTPRDDLARLWRTDPESADEAEWILVTEPLREEIAALEDHPWAGRYQTPIADSSTELLVAPRNGWATRTVSCEPPHDWDRGEVRLSDRGPIFLGENGVELDDLSFECYILMPLERVLHCAEYMVQGVGEDPAYGTPSERLAVAREVVRLRRAIRVVRRARR